MMMRAIGEIAVVVGGSAVLSLIAKATVVSGAALIAAHVARRSRASVRHLLLATGFLCLLALPIVTVVVPSRELSVPVPVARSIPVDAVPFVPPPEMRTPASLPIDVDVAPAGPAVAVRPSRSTLVVIGWLAGVALFFVPMSAGLMHVRRVRQNGLPWRQGEAVVAGVATAHGVRRHIQLLVTESIVGPVTCGVVRPAIMLPREACGWSADALRCAVVHEVEHIRRWDWLVLCLARVVCALYWFHPLVWISWRQLRLEAERACDDAVLRSADADTYAAQLIALAERLVSSRGQSALAMANRSDLSARVSAVLDERRARGPAQWRWIAASSGAGLLLLVAVAPLRAVSQDQKGGESIVIADVRVSARGPDGRSVLQMEGGGAPRGGRYEILAATMVELIGTAYGVDLDAVVGGPSWMGVERYDVVAKMPDDAPSSSITRMLQALLADRFGLVVRSDTRAVPAFVLSKGPAAPKLRRATASGESGCQLLFGINRMSCRNVTIDAFVTTLKGRSTTLRIENATGLDGSWDFDIDGIELATQRGIHENSPMLDAIDRQLGLKLALQSIPAPAVVVERVNRTPSPNPPDVEARLAADPVAFEVASIRPCESVDPRTAGGATAPRISPGGLVTTGCLPLAWHIATAWNLVTQVRGIQGVVARQINMSNIAGAPSWVTSRSFVIQARAPVPVGVGTPLPADAKYRTMLRNLLIDRFKIATHYEDRLVDVYTLVAETPTLRPADASRRSGCRSNGVVFGAPTVVTCQNVTIAQFADELSHSMSISTRGRPIVDETGIQGTWDVTLTYRDVPPAAAAPDVAAEPTGSVSIDEALERQLGLKLREARRSQPVFVIDRIEENPIEN